MPRFATLHAPVPCWNCGGSIADQSDFQWGRIPASYRLGDPIRWLHIGGEIVPPFVLIKGRDEWNCGDPAVGTVIVLDGNLYAIDSPHDRTCPHCSAEIAAVAIEIADNAMASVCGCNSDQLTEWQGTHTGKADIIVVLEDGGFQPRVDWYDREIQYMEHFP